LVTVLIGFGAAIAWGSVNLLMAPLSRSMPAVCLTFWLVVINLIVTGVAAVAFESDRAVSARGVAVAVVAGVFEVVGILAAVRALRVGSVAVVSPIIGLEGGFAALIAISFGESVTMIAAAALLLAVCGGVLTAAEGRAKTAAGAGWATIGAAAFGTTFVLYAHTTPVGPLTTVTVGHATAFVILAPLVIVRRQVGVPRANWRRLALAGTLNGAGFCLFSVAVARGPVAAASVAAAQFSTVAVALGVILLHERPKTHQYVGIAAAAIGTTLIGLFA
jgi:drug/metabolite transporter (DMT)-like permease